MKAVHAERFVPAPPEAVFDVLADPAMHPVIDGSGSLRGPRPGGAGRLGPGSNFGMRMRIVVPYRLTNRVMEFEEGRRIAWSHVGGVRWRYELEPVEGGTRVRETFDMTTAAPLLAPVLQLLGFPRRNRTAMERTLERLAEVAGEYSARPSR